MLDAYYRAILAAIALVIGFAPFAVLLDKIGLPLARAFLTWFGGR
jgi:hypothetical protein